MKSSNTRVRRDSSKKTAIPQAPNKPEPAKGKARSNIDGWDPKGVALVLMSGSESGPEREIAGLNYSAEEFKLIQFIAQRSNQSLGDFLHSAIKARLKLAVVSEELRDAINQAKALYELIEHRVFQPVDAEFSDKIKCGIMDLASDTFKRLDGALDKMIAVATGKGGAR